MQKTKINVPKEFELIVQEFGAKYDGRIKSWYVPENKLISVFNPFIPLSIELVPSSNWENNVRSEYGVEWDAIKREAYKNAKYKCEVCGGLGEKHPVEAHEVWNYDMKNQIQKLIGIDALCPLCHRTKHYGLALISKQEDEINKHLMKINHWKEEDVSKYLNEVFSLYDARSKMKWTLDFSKLEEIRQHKTS